VLDLVLEGMTAASVMVIKNGSRSYDVKVPAMEIIVPGTGTALSFRPKLKQNASSVLSHKFATQLRLSS
jgi:hypothetical protein